MTDPWIVTLRQLVQQHPEWLDLPIHVNEDSNPLIYEVRQDYPDSEGVPFKPFLCFSDD